MNAQREHLALSASHSPLLEALEPRLLLSAAGATEAIAQQATGSAAITSDPFGQLPVLQPISDQHATGGVWHVVPLDAYDPEGLPLTYFAHVEWTGVEYEILTSPAELRLLFPADMPGMARVTVGVAEKAFADQYGYPRVVQSFYVYSSTPGTPPVQSHVPIRPGDDPQDPDRTLTAVRSGDRLYVGTSGGLEIFDVSGNGNPVLLGTYDLPQEGEVWDIHVEGNFAYLAATYAGLLVLDVSDPANVRSLRTESSISLAVDVVVRDGYAFVTDFWTGLVVVDVSNHRDIWQVDVRSTGLDAEARQVVLLGNTAFVADSARGVVAIDISAPTWLGQPQLVFSGSVAALELAGNILYVVDRQGVLTALNVTNPAQPVVLDSITIAGGAGMVKAFGDRVVLSSLTGYSIINVADPTNLQETFTYRLPFPGAKAFLHADSLYLPASFDGVLELRARDVLQVQLNRADLRPQNVSYTPGVYARGEMLQVSGTIHNAGNAGAAPFYWQLRISSDLVEGNADDLVLYTGFFPGLAAGGSSAFSVEVPIPAQAGPGPYYVVIRADSGQTVTELDEGNNVYWSPEADIVVPVGVGWVVLDNVWFTTNEDTPVTLTAGDLLEYAHADHSPLQVVSVRTTDQTRGAIRQQGGNWIFTPEQHYNGLTSLEYVVRDASGAESVATVNVRVRAVNNRPQAESFAVNVDGEPIVIVLRGSDVETPDSELIYEIVTQPQHGTLEVLSNGVVRYTPFEGSYGQDSFVYRVTDAGDPPGRDILSDTGTVTIQSGHIIEGRGVVVLPGANGRVMRVVVRNVDRAIVFAGSQPGEISRILLVGTRENSNVRVIGRDVTIGSIEADGAMGAIRAPGSVLTGNLTIAGSVRQVRLGGVIGPQQTLTINAGGLARGDETIQLLLGNVLDAQLDTNGLAIRRLVVDSWHDGAQTPADTIQALWIGQFRVGGPFQADVNLSGSNRDWSLRRFDARGLLSDVSMTMPGGVQFLRANGWDGGGLQAAWAGDVISRGDLLNADIELGMSPVSQALNRLQVRGTVHASAIALNGHFGRIVAADWADSTLDASAGRLLNVRGQAINGEFTATGTDTRGISVRQVLIAGPATDVTIDLAGDFGRIVAGGMQDVQVNARSGRQMRVNGDWSRSSLEAASLQRLVVQGSFLGRNGSDADVRISGLPGVENLSRGVVRGSLVNAVWDVAGWIGQVVVGQAAQSSLIASTGGMGAVRVGASRDSSFLAGLNLPDGARRPDPAAGAGQFANPIARINAFEITGRGADAAFESSNVAAAQIGRIHLRGVQSGNGGESFGVWVRSSSMMGVAPIGVLTVDGDRPLSPEQILAGTSYIDQDFMVRII